MASAWAVLRRCLPLVLAALLWVPAFPACPQPMPLSLDDQPLPASTERASADRLTALAERMAGVTQAEAAEPIEPTPEVVVAEIESTPLGRAPAGDRSRLGTNNQVSDAEDDGQTPAAWTGGSMVTTLGALAIVIALIFAVRFGLAKATGTPIAAGTSAVEVLARTSVAPRNHVLLLRVGARVLVVGESAGGLRTLSEVDEEAEVASLLQAVETAKPQSMASNFSSLMGRLNGQYDAELAEVVSEASTRTPPPDRGEVGGDRAEAPVDRAREGLASVAGRLRLRSGVLDREA